MRSIRLKEGLEAAVDFNRIGEVDRIEEVQMASEQ